uniref:Uncharacterized protein n=1 Tax=Amorphochlora amoebiformis TaxID=1561963 RepID=A0A7S0GWH4_9EUKA|mmetsp:Transcript_2041/g.2838  ORF Transcript_2041/g.2838 Transcript_2041/m.2838 type:complete len:446 (+) Transcript_2041:89-1426(+)
MFGFGKKKQLIAKLEADLEDVQTSVEEAEVTVSAKDSIINEMLNEQKKQQLEISDLEQQITRLEENLLIEERTFVRALKKALDGESSSPRSHLGSFRANTSSAKQSISTSSSFRALPGMSKPTSKAKKQDNNAQVRSSRGSNLEPPVRQRQDLLSSSNHNSTDVSRGVMTLNCSTHNVHGSKLVLKLRQNGVTLPNCKSQVVRAKNGTAKFKPVSVDVPSLDEKLPLEIEIWSKGRLSSKTLATVSVPLTTVISLFRNKEPADFVLHKPTKRPSRASLPSQPTAQAYSQAQAQVGDLKSPTPSDGSQMRLRINLVTIKAASRVASQVQGQMGDEALYPSSMSGVTMEDIVGRWTAADGAFYYVTKKGRVLDIDKKCFGSISIAEDKDDYDIGMVNDTEGGVFYFARLSKGVLRWSDRDKWRSRNRQAVVFDEKEQTQQKKKKTGS